ncbi:MAG: hypothetical protein GX552_09055 [Chloroflexi bacterium]|jgi:hypothetical protein|nr:hypothetical protein [Chloroflexota bacterium]
MDKQTQTSNGLVDTIQGQDKVQEQHILDQVVNTARIRELQRAAALLSEEGHTQLAESLREWIKRLNRALGTDEIPPEVWIG